MSQAKTHSYEELFARLRGNEIVLTANQRISRFLCQEWARRQRSMSVDVFASLPCFALQIWFERVWTKLLAIGMPERACRPILNANQERLVWSSILAEDLQENQLLSVESLVDTVIEAWKNLRLWCKDLDDLDEETEEVKLFKKWVNQFRARCDDLKVMDQSDRLFWINSHIHKLPNQNSFILVGFDALAPLQESIFLQLRNMGGRTDFFDIDVNKQHHVVAVADTSSEILAAAQWAAAIVAGRDSNSLKSKESTSIQNPKIGIVIPDLANLRQQVETTFNEVFEPQVILPQSSRHAPGFNLSAGQPLAQTPLYSTAFLTLQLLGGELEINQWRRLFGSPFLWRLEHLADRLTIIDQLQNRFERISCDTMLKAVEAFYGSDIRLDIEWVSRLTHFMEMRLALIGKTLTYTQWGFELSALLNALGWPGERTLDTLEYQQLTRWAELLALLAELDSVSESTVNWQQALSQLTRIAYTPFQPQTKTSPVQILGLLEAAGLQFDHLWVMGLDYRVWPAPCQPNPFIPLHQQKKWDMPKASAQRELTLATQLTRRLISSSSQTVLSYAQNDGDQPLQASPLLDGFERKDVAQLTLESVQNHFELNPPAVLECIEDQRAPTLLQGRSGRGGSQIIKNQALCPFKAFAEHRLLAKNRDKFRMGVSPLVRGNLIHKTLELLWCQLKDQQSLLALSLPERDDLIDAALHKAWSGLTGVESLGETTVAMEKLRTKELVNNWLDLEAQRPPFRVLFQEKSLYYKVDKLEISVRYDRSDQNIENDEIMVIDYKTGRTDIKKWFGERPEEPQIPLYAIAERHPISAVAFAEINRHAITLKGVSRSGEEGQEFTSVQELDKWDMPNSWDALTVYWRQTIEVLAQQFCTGVAVVDPKSETTCQFCDLKPFCRIGFTADSQSGRDASE